MDDATALANLSENVRRLIAERGLSQSSLARACGENVVMINSVVLARHMPGVGPVARIADALEVTVDELLANPRKKSRRPA